MLFTASAQTHISHLVSSWNKRCFNLCSAERFQHYLIYLLCWKLWIIQYKSSAKAKLQQQLLVTAGTGFCLLSLIWIYLHVVSQSSPLAMLPASCVWYHKHMCTLYNFMFYIWHTTHITERWERKTLPPLYDHLCKTHYLQLLFSEEVNDLGHTYRKSSLPHPQKKRKKRIGKEKKLSMHRLLRLQCSLKRNNRFLPHNTTGNLQEMC